MIKRILYAVNELPFPPRNGVTIPSFNYLNGLKCDQYLVDLVLLTRPTDSLKSEDIESNRAIVNRLYILPLKKNSASQIIAEYILRIKPTYYNYNFDKQKLRGILANNYDAIIYSPISATIISKEVEENNHLKKLVQIGILSDCFSYSVKQLSTISSSDFKLDLTDRLFLKRKYFESFQERYFERKVIEKLDMVVCQTEVDRQAFEDLGYKKLLHVEANGVSPDLYNKSLEDEIPKQVLFLGSLDGKYSYVSEWLLCEAWPNINKRFPHLKLKLVGKGLAPHLIEKINGMSSVSYFSYIEKISDAYGDCQILLAPIFMNCGLVNKTLEAMAAGVIVIGDKTAFNGIKGFADGKTGLIFNSLSDMLNKLALVIEDQNLFQSLRKKAKAIITNNFNWDNKTSRFNEKLNRLMDIKIESESK